MPYIKKAKIKALIEDWIAEYVAASKGKLRPISGKVSKERLYNIVWWRTTQLLDFYNLGLIDVFDLWEYVRGWKEYVEEGSPEWHVLEDTDKRACEAFDKTIEQYTVSQKQARPSLIVEGLGGKSN